METLLADYLLDLDLMKDIFARFDDLDKEIKEVIDYGELEEFEFPRK